ncbi:MAG: hypothetical protein ACTSUV_07105 [Candidatus Ranarchaeia archaeon]
MTENISDIAQTLEKLAHALQTTKEEGIKSSGISTSEIEKKLDTIIELLNEKVIKKLDSLVLGPTKNEAVPEKPIETKKPITQPVVPKPSPIVEPLPPIPTPPPAEKPKISEIEVRNAKNKLGDLERQITDLEFQFKSGFVDEEDYKTQISSLSTQREEILKQIKLG